MWNAGRNNVNVYAQRSAWVRSDSYGASPAGLSQQAPASSGRLPRRAPRPAPLWGRTPAARFPAATPRSPIEASTVGPARDYPAILAMAASPIRGHLLGTGEVGGAAPGHNDRRRPGRAAPQHGRRPRRRGGAVRSAGGGGDCLCVCAGGCEGTPWSLHSNVTKPTVGRGARGISTSASGVTGWGDQQCWHGHQGF